MPFIGRKKRTEDIGKRVDQGRGADHGQRSPVCGKDGADQGLPAQQERLATAENISDTMNRLAFEKAFRKHCGSGAEPEKKDAKKSPRKW